MRIRNKLPSSVGYFLKFVSNVAGETQYQPAAAESAEEVSLD
jgi:hypothetical protein